MLRRPWVTVLGILGLQVILIGYRFLGFFGPGFVSVISVISANHEDPEQAQEQPAAVRHCEATPEIKGREQSREQNLRRGISIGRIIRNATLRYLLETIVLGVRGSGQ